MGDAGLTLVALPHASSDTAYDAAIASLFARTGGTWTLGLDRMRALLAELGEPQRRFRAIHVAGTNGKGSVLATLDALLRDRFDVARYTSPHLVDFRERMVVNGRAVEAPVVSEWVERWTPTVARLGATFFEATTAMAFDLFAQAGTELALIETGLGGRLDATNVLLPEVAVVTSVGLDHVEYLGDTVEAIAGEKAGIFKPHVPAVIGELDPGVRDLLAERARAAGASRVWVAADDLPMRDIELSAMGTTCTLTFPDGPATLTTPLLGRHQAQNMATAILALMAMGILPSRASLQEALHRVRLPGRFQRVGPFVFDVAHNPAGAEVLARTLAEAGVPRPVIVLLTVLADKDWRNMMTALAPAVDQFVLTHAPTAPASRAWDPRDALAFAHEHGWRAVLVEDFDLALARVRVEGGTVLVTGSFHTVGDAMARLQVDPLAG